MTDTLDTLDTQFTFANATAAGAACGLSKKAILRRATQLAEVGAVKDARGNWRITAAQLEAIGLKPNRYQPHDPMTLVAEAQVEEEASRQVSPPSRQVSPPTPDLSAAENMSLRARITELERDLAQAQDEAREARHQAELARAVADERVSTADFLQAIAALRPRRRWWQSQIDATHPTG
jgi:hypothetical protein